MSIYRHNIIMILDYESIGKRIRNQRNILGYSQEQLAFESNLSVPYISQIENGHKTASLNAFIQIADVFECTLDWLVFGSDAFYDNCSDYDFNAPVETCSVDEKKYLYDLLMMNVKMMKTHNDRHVES